jgi:hypothetical protein
MTSPLFLLSGGPTASVHWETYSNHGIYKFRSSPEVSDFSYRSHKKTEVLPPRHSQMRFLGYTGRRGDWEPGYHDGGQGWEAGIYVLVS